MELRKINIQSLISHEQYPAQISYRADFPIDKDSLDLFPLPQLERCYLDRGQNILFYLYRYEKAIFHAVSPFIAMRLDKKFRDREKAYMQHILMRTWLEKSYFPECYIHVNNNQQPCYYLLREKRVNTQLQKTSYVYSIVLRVALKNKSQLVYELQEKYSKDLNQIFPYIILFSGSSDPLNHAEFKIGVNVEDYLDLQKKVIFQSENLFELLNNTLFDTKACNQNTFALRKRNRLRKVKLKKTAHL